MIKNGVFSCSKCDRKIGIIDELGYLVLLCGIKVLSISGYCSHCKEYFEFEKFTSKFVQK